MKPLIYSLVAISPAITDGARGTLLQQRGLLPSSCPEEWNLSHPDVVRSIAEEYVASGSSVILTNTFGASRILLSKYGLESKTREIVRQGVSRSRDVTPEHTYVFGSVGRTGTLVTMGLISTTAVEEAFREQIHTAADAGIDGIVVETMGDIEEAVIASQAAVETGLPVVTSIIFTRGKNRDRTMMGVSAEEAISRLTDAGIDVFGANCGVGPREYIPLVYRISSATDLPLWLKPSAGTPEVTAGKISYRMEPGDFAHTVKSFCIREPIFVGGCCGTTPEFIRALRQVVSTAP